MNSNKKASERSKKMIRFQQIGSAKARARNLPRKSSPGNVVLCAAVCLMLGAALVLSGCPASTGSSGTPANTTKAITAFSFASPAATGTINEATHTIAVTVPYGTTVTALVANFTVSTGATVAVGSTPQVSGTTPNNFTSPVTYTVTATDATTLDYIVTVTIARNSAKDFLSYALNAGASGASISGTISTANHTIAVTLPFGSTVGSYVATYTLSAGATAKVGSTAQESGRDSNNFARSVTYTVTAEDGSTQNYTVTVSISTNTAKAITAFSFQALTPPVTGTINEIAHTIAVTVPYTADVAHLVAIFSFSGSSIKVGTADQTSGITINNFTSPVTYVVTDAVAGTQSYVVTVTIAPTIIAFSFQGLTPAVVGTIDQDKHTITATVPFLTSVGALVATFTLSAGATAKVNNVVQSSGVTSNPFTRDVIYTVTAPNSSTKDYTVTVIEGPDAPKAMLTFSLNTIPVSTGVIDETAKTVEVKVQASTVVTNLIARFTTSGASVKIGSVVQASDSTTNDFTNPLTYTVVNTFGRTQDYTVTVSPRKWVALTGVADLSGSNYVSGLVVSGSKIYATSNGKLYISADNAGTWTPIDRTKYDPGASADSTLSVVAASGDTIIMGARNNGLFFSTNNGSSWTHKAAAVFSSRGINCAYIAGANFYLGTDYGIYISKNSGADWTFIAPTTASGIPGATLYGIALSGSSLLAATSYGLGVSSDEGTYWTKYADVLANYNCTGQTIAGSAWYVPTDGGLSVSSDNGTHWTNYTSSVSGFVGNRVTSVAVSGSIICASSNTTGISVSFDAGAHWLKSTTTNGLGSDRIWKVAILGSKIFANSEDGGLYAYQYQ